MTGAAAVLRHAEPVMGTVVSFAVAAGTADPDAVRSALARACAGLHAADAVFSTWVADSPVSRLRRGELALADAPPEVAEVLERCALAREASGGWFDPWAMPGGVDPTGLVKGWAVSRAAAVVRDAGAAGVMVNGGGDIAVHGRPEPGRAWRLGVRDPAAADRLVCVVELPDGCSALATSAAYERGGHVLDPSTGEPAVRLVSASVAGPELDLADALATALFAAGEDLLADVARLPGYSGLVVRPDGSLAATAAFPSVG